jgi:hypothetical protein
VPDQVGRDGGGGEREIDREEREEEETGTHKHQRIFGQFLLVNTLEQMEIN